MRERRAAKAWVTVIAILLVVCTFAARPLRAGRTAKVAVATVRSRRLEYTESVQASRWYSGDARLCAIPCRLPGALTVTAVYVSELDSVAAGDPLLAFDAAGGEWALGQAEQGLLSARISYDACVSALDEEILSLRGELSAAKATMRTLRGEELAIAAERYERDEARLAALEAGESDRLALETARLEEARSLAEELRRLQGQGWVLTSPAGGFVQDLRAATGSAYGGLEALLTVCVPDGRMTLLAPVGREWVDLRRTVGVRVRVRRDAYEAEAQWVGEEEQNGTLYARLLLEADAPRELTGVCSVELSAVSAESCCLAPEAALGEDRQTLFVLCERQGYFGREYCVEAQRVVLGDASGGLVQVKSGLLSGDRVVVASDRPLMSGDEVLPAP